MCFRSPFLLNIFAFIPFFVKIFTLGYRKSVLKCFVGNILVNEIDSI